MSARSPNSWVGVVEMVMGGEGSGKLELNSKTKSKATIWYSVIRGDRKSQGCFGISSHTERVGLFCL